MLKKKFDVKKIETQDLYKELLKENKESTVLTKEDLLLLA